MGSKNSSKKDNITLFTAIFMIVMGIGLAIGGAGFAGRVISILLTVLGVLIIVFGVLNVLGANVVYGIGEIVIGIIVIVFGWTLLWVALIVIAVLMILLGLQGLINKAPILSTIGQILAGVLILLLAFGNNFAWSFVNVLYIVAGVVMAIDGLLLLLKK